MEERKKEKDQNSDFAYSSSPWQRFQRLSIFITIDAGTSAMEKMNKRNLSFGPFLQTNCECK